MRNVELAVWDGDNTIWNWMDYAVPAYEAMCEEIARIAGRTPDETASAMKRFYTSKGTIEDERLIQGLSEEGFFSHVTDFDMKMCIQAVRATFSRIREEKLKVYEGIPEVMKEIDARGTRQIILTDAPGSQARLRLRHSGLGKFIKSVHSMPYTVLPDLQRVSTEDVLLHELPAEKPHIDLEQVLGMTRERIRDGVAIIGDNMAKDMALADIYGCLGVHAAYGATTPDLIDRIKRFAPPRVAARNTQVVTTPAGPNIRVANNPSEIIERLYTA